MATINAVGNGLSLSTGSASFVGSNSPTLITPILGVANATSINFGGTSLANYLQNTWPPTFTFATPGDLSVSYSTQTGVYTRIGNFIVASFTLICTPTYTTASGAASIPGLPIVAANSMDAGPIGAQSVGVVYPLNCTKISLNTTSSTSALSIVGMGSSVASSNLTTTNFPTTVAITLAGTIVYHV